MQSELPSFLERWVYAIKPRSWPKLAVAALLGQAIGIAAAGSIDPWAFALGILFTGFDLVFVVLLNDFGDQEVDTLKRRLFPESCSPKTIPDGILQARSVGQAGLGAGAAALGIAVFAQEFLGRPGLAWAAAICLLLFVFYTFPPIRLNYRGGGEILEMLGVGFALPWLHAYLQSGVAIPPGIVILPGFALLAMASALASGLADEDTDRIGGKRTFATMFGGAAVRQGVEGLVAGAMLVWAVLPRLAPGFATFWMVTPAVLVMVYHFRGLRRVSELTDARFGQAAYKEQLHHVIWHGTAVMAALVVASIFVGSSAWA